ncbi:DUF3592 domain-containing protein [Robbsia andropogonis]|uniref:DUF3592 domain-containing protein n=1 Tax=Robbsia andropogonis TaxID=28092 RepID=UPI0009DCA2ED
MLGFYIIVLFILTVPSLTGWLVGAWAGRSYPGGKRNGFAAAFVILGCCCSAFFCYLGVDAVSESRARLALQTQERSWPSVTATIEAHRVDSFSVRGRATSWRPVWLYSYDVDGVRYRVDSDTLRGGYSASSYTSKDIAEENAETRPVGSKVLAYYNPQNPKQSVLDRRYDGPHFDFGLSLLMFIIAAPCLFLTSMACVLWSRLSSPAGI